MSLYKTRRGLFIQIWRKNWGLPSPWKGNWETIEMANIFILTICVRSCFIQLTWIVQCELQCRPLLSGRAKHVLDLWRGQLKRNTCGFIEEMGRNQIARCWPISFKINQLHLRFVLIHLSLDQTYVTYDVISRNHKELTVSKFCWGFP